MLVKCLVCLSTGGWGQNHPNFVYIRGLYTETIKSIMSHSMIPFSKYIANLISDRNRNPNKIGITYKLSYFFV